MIKTLIVDDEFQGRTFLDKVITKLFPELTIIGQAATIHEAADINFKAGVPTGFP